jgi:carboxypeptidase Q
MKIKSPTAAVFVMLVVVIFVSTGYGQNVSGGQSPTTSTLPQTSASNDPVIRKMWVEGMEKSQLYPLAQELLDSIGPRLTGAPEQKRANDWATAMYQKWGIPVRTEQYGTWNAWRRGTMHIDLIAPRVRSLEGMLMTYSPGTKGSVEGPVVVFPNVKNAAEFEAWLPQARGKFILVWFPEPACRPDASWKEFGSPESFERMQKERAAAREAWYAGHQRTGSRGRELLRRLGEAGAVGALVSFPSQGWGVSKMGSATETIPEIGLSCEDYGLLFRLAQNNQGPILRVNADAQFLGEVPVSNVIAELRGKEKPNEYVVLSAHFDSWDAASGATDNGSGTIMMMEAMRILQAVYPNPKRTILAAHWNGEEQGLNGSRAFAADHPEVVNGLQALFNQDNGTGRIVKISMQGLGGASAFFRRWFAQMPNELTRDVNLVDPGTPERGSDNAAFICYGAPAFGLGSRSWDYETYTWHTNRDTFDKLVFDDLKNNAVLVAMLAYLAAEDAQRIPREPRVTQTDPKTGQPTAWPACTPPARSSAQSKR